MTRKRTRESLGRMLHEPCFYCDGTGQLQSKETIAYEILRADPARAGRRCPATRVVVNAHPAVVDVLNGTEKRARSRTPRARTCAASSSCRARSTTSSSSTCGASRRRARATMSDATTTSARDERVTINKEFESFDAFIQEYVTNISRTGVFIRAQHAARRSARR